MVYLKPPSAVADLWGYLLDVVYLAPRDLLDLDGHPKHRNVTADDGVGGSHGDDADP